MSLLACEDLAVRVANVRVVDRLQIDIGPGECWGLLGSYGIGKTTLLKCMAGLN